MNERRGLLLCDDLLFSSRISGTAQSFGLQLSVVRSVSQIQALVADSTFACVIVDLALVGTAIDDLGRCIRNCGAESLKLVAYGSHVDVAQLKAARNAGCDVVLPRSKFVEQLSTDLCRWYGLA